MYKVTLVPTAVVQCPSCEGKGYNYLQWHGEFLGEEPKRERCYRCNGHGKVQEYAEVTTLD